MTGSATENSSRKGYYTTLIGDDAVKLINQQDPTKPFFLYFASLAPHAPFQAPEEYLKRYPDIQDKQRREYCAMISCLDDQVGRIVAALEKKGMRDNTIILFASDNGGATSGLFARAPFTGGARKKRWSRVGQSPRLPTASCAAARAVSTKAACACRPSSTGQENSSLP